MIDRRRSTALRARLTLARAIVETLERRELLCATHDGNTAASVWTPALDAAFRRNGADHAASWYTATDTTSIDGTNNGSTDGSTEAITFPTNAAGLPLLSSRPGLGGLNIFLDYDGNGTNTPFDIDGNAATFNATEQQHIYDGWRDNVSFFSMLNVNVTTVLPTTPTNFAWLLVSNTISGGYAFVGQLGTDGPHGFVDKTNGMTRHTGMAHEIGHLLNLQ